jgi:LuxR family maltose regulon positive regulatory protein
MLKRRAVSEKMQQILHVPLTVMIAGPGFGKTHEVRRFIGEHQRSKYAAICVHITGKSSIKSPDKLWSAILEALTRQGYRFPFRTFPKSSEQYSQAIKDLCLISRDTSLLIFIDDYHEVESAEFNAFAESIACSDVTQLHLVLVSREPPELPIETLEIKGCVALLTSSDFTVSSEEISTYFALNQQNIDIQTADLLAHESEGWITAIVCALQRYREIGVCTFGMRPYKVLQQTELMKYTENQLAWLKILSLIPWFNTSLASVLLDQTITEHAMHELAYHSSFIIYDEERGMYRMHRMFKKVLRDLYEGDEQQTISIYCRAGLWFLDHNLPLAGYRALLKARSYDTIMQRLSVMPEVLLLEKHPEFFVHLFSAFPTEFTERYFFVWLKYIGFMMTNIDRNQAMLQIQQMRGSIGSNTELSQQEKQKIEGELQLIESYGVFNDISRMHTHMQQAGSLLGGPSTVANTEKIITFGSPHALFLYYQTSGTFHKTVDGVQQLFALYHQLSGGCGTGFDDLLQAELLLETAELNHAEQIAWQAYHKADLSRQFEVAVNAQFVLARIGLVRGEIGDVRGMLDAIRDTARRTDNPIVLGQIDLIIAYISSEIDIQPEIAPWITSCDSQQYRVLYHAYGFVGIVYGKYLLRTQQYIRLQVYCTHIRELCTPFHNQLGMLHAYLLIIIHLYLR